jgi:hypothetical protein
MPAFKFRLFGALASHQPQASASIYPFFCMKRKSPLAIPPSVLLFIMPLIVAIPFFQVKDLLLRRDDIQDGIQKQTAYYQYSL